MTMRISLLADEPALIPDVANMRWREWGHPPEPEDPAWWLETTAREAGRTTLPVTVVAHDDEEVLGAVGIGEFDLEERRDRSPWVLGMIVRTDHRGTGVGRALMGHLAQWAVANGFPEMWVATGPTADGFYRRCGWILTESLYCESQGETVTVLRKPLA
jgi:GNAT superfamily N-acetyltransferase